jgi:hypothetical protein
MTTARTQQHHVGRGGAARPRVASPAPDGFTPVSAESFEFDPSSAAVWPDGGEEDGDVEAFDPSTLDYDPADHTVDDVKAHVEANPDQADAILELELNGKGRSGLLSWLEQFTAGDEG